MLASCGDFLARNNYIISQWSKCFTTRGTAPSSSKTTSPRPQERVPTLLTGRNLRTNLSTIGCMRFSTPRWKARCVGTFQRKGAVPTGKSANLLMDPWNWNATTSRCPTKQDLVIPSSVKVTACTAADATSCTPNRTPKLGASAWMSEPPSTSAGAIRRVVS